MPRTVNSSFTIFMRDYVNCDSDKTQKARASRDWMLSKIQKFADDTGFPTLYTERMTHFGSFTRKTKTRPLDDIDLMITLKAQGCVYDEYQDNIEIRVPSTSNFFTPFCNEGTLILNSRKIINVFVNYLSSIEQYSNAQIKRNQEAATLKLTSYEWNFDIVPCFFTALDSYNRNYYIIPDGNGNWKKTDPRIDKERVTRLNKKHKGIVLPVIRLAKFWNKRARIPSMSSYLLEIIILNYYEQEIESKYYYIATEIIKIFRVIEKNVFSEIQDPKGIQGNINNLTHSAKTKISERAGSDYITSYCAYNLEKEGKNKESITKWGEIFGHDFPKYD